MKYVVYLTKYKGDKLPSWYIGSSNIDKIKNGYNGTILSKKYKEKYDKEQKENKHFFKTRVLSYHKTRQCALDEELRLQKKHNVVKNKDYINESYAQVNGFFGRTMTKEEKKSMVNNRVKSGNGDYHHGKQPMDNPIIVEKIKQARIKNGNWHGYDIKYNNVLYRNIKELCNTIDFSEKRIRKIMLINNIKYLNDIIINNIRYLDSLEPKNKKWMNRNIIEKDDIKYMLYYKLDIPDGYKLLEKYTNPRKVSINEE